MRQVEDRESLEEGDGLSILAGLASAPLLVVGDEAVGIDDGDAMLAQALEGVEIDGKSGDQGLAFAGLHFGDLALVEHGAADELGVEVPHVEHAATSLADDGEGFRQQYVERLTVGDARLEFSGLAAKGLVGERTDGGLERVDLRDDGAQLSDERRQKLFVTSSEERNAADDGGIERARNILTEVLRELV